jgi:hypothetical protein
MSYVRRGDPEVVGGGHTTNEIASLLGSSQSAICTFRNYIRMQIPPAHHMHSRERPIPGCMLLNRLYIIVPSRASA